MKLRAVLKKFLWRSPQDREDEQSADSVDEAFTVGSGEAPSSWIPSQQDERPRH